MTIDYAGRLGLSGRGLSPRQAEARYWREAIQDREAERAAAVQQAKEGHMSRHKIALGGHVEKFPSTDPLRGKIGDARAALVAAFEEAEQAQAVQRRIESGTASDPQRFPSLGGGAR